MIKSVTVTNYLGESLKMELTNPYDSGIAITDITVYNNIIYEGV